MYFLDTMRISCEFLKSKLPIAPITNTKVSCSHVVHPYNYIYSLPQIFQDFRGDGYGDPHRMGVPTLPYSSLPKNADEACGDPEEQAGSHVIGHRVPAYRHFT